MSIASYVANNHGEIVKALVGVHAIATVIVNVTPTPKDNQVLRKYYRALEVLAGIITPLAKR